MLRTRLWVGAVLIALTAGVLVIDQGMEPWFPFLFLFVVVLALLCCAELLQILPASGRPMSALCYGGVALVLIANWIPYVLRAGSQAASPQPEPWVWIAGCFTAVVLAAFLVEMALFQGSGEALTRISLTTWTVAYLGLLPSFLVQLRWLSDSDRATSSRRATAALALAIFVPKCCDIGAYFTGRFLGKHKMDPLLSPKKT